MSKTILSRTTFLCLTFLLSFNFKYSLSFQPVDFVTLRINSPVERAFSCDRSLIHSVETSSTILCMCDSRSEVKNTAIPFDGSEDRFDRWRFFQDFLEGDYPSPDVVNIILYRVLKGALKLPQTSDGSDSEAVEISAEVREKIEEILSDYSTEGRVEAVVTITNTDIDYEEAHEKVSDILQQLEMVLPDPIEAEQDYKSLWDTVIEIHGREAVKYNESQKPVSLDWKIASTVTRVLLHYDFLTHGIVDDS